MDSRLGRLYIPDERDTDFPMSAALPEEASERTYRYWWAGGWWGDQGHKPQCVAYSWLHWLEDGPTTHPDRTPGADPLVDPTDVYNRAQKIDQWPGENYDGTSVRAGAKILREEGLISEFRWANTIEEVVQAILERGPVVFGSWWYSSMFYPDEEGYIEVSGSQEGGHAYLLNGVNTRIGVFRIKNSWGRSWGKDGYAYISIEDMERLLNEFGEACLAVEIPSGGNS